MRKAFAPIMLLPVVFFLISASARAETFELTINVSICDTTWQDSLYVTFNGQGYSIEPGNPLILQVTQGYYTISATCPGNGSYVLENIYITEDTEVNILLPCMHYPVRNVYVDPLTSEAVWSVPRIDKLSEDFEPAQFPPPAWQAESEGEGWYRTDDGSGGGWTVQPRGGHYACVNDLLAGAGNDGSTDYLVTPVLELDYTGNYVLEFDSYYDSLNGQQAMVEYSLDGGGTWDVLHTLSLSTDWDFISLDLSSFSGQGSDPVMFAFHADDQGLDASGWAIDDVEVFSPDRPSMLIDYYVYVDDSLVGTTDTTRFFIEGLTYGQDYNVCVAARYPSGLSETACDSVYLVCNPPVNLGSFWNEECVMLSWDPPEGSTVAGSGDSLTGYHIYRSPGDDNYEFLAEVDSSQTSYCDTVSRNEYCYKIKASYTKDGDTCLSEFSNSDCSTVGMDEMQSSEGLSVFPNPAVNTLNIQCSNRMDRIQVYNYLGQLVEVVSPGSFSAKLDLSGYPKGILLLKATTSNTTHTRKIIVNK